MYINAYLVLSSPSLNDATDEAREALLIPGTWADTEMVSAKYYKLLVSLWSLTVHIYIEIEST